MNTQTVFEAVKKAKRKFIEDTLLPHAVRDATSQEMHPDVRHIFKPAPTNAEEKKQHDEQVTAFKQALTEELRTLSNYYEGQTVTGESHIQVIRDMAERLRQKHSEVLNENKLLFGVASKALNVYLKYLCCAGFDVRPPHCPFDYDLIAELKPPAGVQYRWTYAEETDYRAWVGLAESAAETGGFDSLSAWEIVTWERIQQKKRERELNASAKKRGSEVSGE